MKRLFTIMIACLCVFAVTACTAAPAPSQTAPAQGGETAAPGTEATQAPAQGGTIKIGGLAPLTGGVAVYGAAASNGAKLYIKELNANGGVLGQQVEFILEDEKGDATEATNAYNKLVNNDGVVAIIGDVTSKPTIAVAQRAAADNMPMISPTATAKEVTTAGTNVFRACFLDPFQGETMANFAAESLKVKTAAIIYNTGDDYSVGLYESFKTVAEAAGIQIVAAEGYAAGDIDFKAQLTNIAAANPEVLFVPDYYNTIVLIAGQAKEVGLDAALLGADGWDGVLGATTDASILEGAYFSNHYSTEDTDPTVQNFLTGYEAEYGESPNAFAALGYDAAKILFDAMERAGSTDADAVIAALQATEIDGVTGHIVFDAERNPIKSCAIIKIVDGKYTLFEKR